MPDCLLVFIGQVESIKRLPAIQLKIMYGYIPAPPVKHRSGPVLWQDLPSGGKSSFATRFVSHFWMNQSEMFVCLSKKGPKYKLFCFFRPIFLLQMFGHETKKFWGHWISPTSYCTWLVWTSRMPPMIKGLVTGGRPTGAQTPQPKLREGNHVPSFQRCFIHCHPIL